MPDRGRFWSPAPDWSRAELRGEGLHIAAVPAAAMCLVSGDLAGFLDRHCDGLACGGPRDICDPSRYALRLAPDRMLLVGGRPPGAVGWSDGAALTDVSDGFVLIDVTGPAAREVMALGAAYDFDSDRALPAESATMIFAGLKLSVARTRSGWRLHVERSLAAALWHWLEQVAREYAPAHTLQDRSAR